MPDSRGLNRGIRDKNGEIRQKSGETLVRTLRKTYGADFAPGARGDVKLKDLLKGYGSLKDRYVVRGDIDLTKPIYDQALGTAKKGGRR